VKDASAGAKARSSGALKPIELLPWHCRAAAACIAAALIAAAALAVYCNSFRGALVFDDLVAVTNNSSIRDLNQLYKVFSPPSHGETVSGRPLLNFSYAINYAIGGENVLSYHIVNLAIHIFGALLLFGILRRTLLLPVFSNRFRMAAMPLAFAVSLIWVVHPLQTESVTYIAQRAESLSSMFILLTLYCAIRGATVNRKSHQKAIRVFWFTAACMACLLGAAVKEIVVAAPLLVYLYDAIFLSGSFGKALRLRWPLYVGLAASWVLLACLVWHTVYSKAPSEETIATPLAYFFSQPGVILHYLRMVFWPHPLCLDYFWPVAQSWEQILPATLIVAALGIVTIWGLALRKPWAFAGAWFFLILAPTSSFLPLGQLAFEHRMYLPLAAVLTLTVVGLFNLGRWAVGKRRLNWPIAAGIAGASLAGACVALGILTFQRNWDYESELAVWRHDVEYFPNNSRAYNHLGHTYYRLDRLDEAVEQYELALKTDRPYLLAHNNLAEVLRLQGKLDQALEHCRKAVESEPQCVGAYSNMGVVLESMGKYDEAIECFNEALDINPRDVTTLNNLGKAMSDLGRLDKATEYYQKALAEDDQYPLALNNYGNVLFRQGKYDEAVALFETALKNDPDYVEAHSNLGNALHRLKRDKESVEHYEIALNISPDYIPAMNNMGVAMLDLGELDQSIACFQKAIEINPKYIQAYCNMGNVLLQQEKVDEAIDQLNKALKISPRSALAHHNMGSALCRKGKLDDAMAHYRTAVEINPDYAEAKNHLVTVLFIVGGDLFQEGQFVKALSLWQEALLVQPDNVNVMNLVAWVLATCSDPALRNGQEALNIATRASKLTGGNDPLILDTLAATYAEVGLFSEASKTATDALRLSSEQSNKELCEGLRSRILLYDSGKAFHEVNALSSAKRN
jgi:protein O-mannosyl-transferase